MQYTDEQKAEAVRLYLEVGPDEAARQVGCSRRSIYGWLGLHNVQAKTNPERRVETEARHDAKRQQIRELLLDQAIDALARMKEPHYDYRGKDVTRVDFEEAPADAFKAYATAAAILIDKYRLEMGESTARTEVRGQSLADVELERMAEEFKRQATDADS